MDNVTRLLKAVLDPTKVEAFVRAQIAKRKKAHETADAQRKLAEAEKRANKIKKRNKEFTMVIYRIKECQKDSSPSRKFRVESNATQPFRPGVVVHWCLTRRSMLSSSKEACDTEQAARELLNNHEVEEDWDLEYGAAILEATD